ncbi:hypothetical protein SAMN05421740_102719 [Parapedobacter koreensis]|uniref:Uncharacterized protein n=1 Tax=Parapedobacter koreensis TaxID=332977 RepID=A0A1H7K131_9SPHI|nr:hypothetical protein SAMN05421740_102719 [Parapedobacter koreensis]
MYPPKIPSYHNIVGDVMPSFSYTFGNTFYRLFGRIQPEIK